MTSGDKQQPGPAGDYPANLRRQFDRWCDEFESEWSVAASTAGAEPPKIETYLSKCPPDLHEQLLPELLALELDYRVERGEAPTLQDYLTRFGGLRPIVEQAFENNAALCETHGPGSTRGLRSSRSAATVNFVGQTIGKYEILAELGRGGMGVVYQARQTDLDRIVAVKMLLAGPHAQEQDLEYFRREAEAVARLQHPHIVQVFEVGEHQGLPYFSLEFLQRGPLSNQLDGTPQPPQQAAELIATLARALHHAHERGVVHRDLKPGNILLAEGGAPKITDFGLAKRLDNQSHTVTGSVLGTPSYMAPEQAAGDSRRIGPAADIYGLGAILYELLTGRPPFKGETPWDTVSLVLNEDPVPPSRLQPKVPRDLETICLKCLHKDSARRYANAQQLAEDLDRFRGGEPIHARPVLFIERAWKWARRRPAVAALAVALSLAVIAGLIGTTSLWVVAERRRVIAEETARRARQEVRENLIAATDDPSFLRDGAQPARNLVLRRALQYFREFATQRQGDDDLALDVADAFERAGRALAELGDSAEALKELQQASAIYERLESKRPQERQVHFLRAHVLLKIANLETKLGQFAAAEASLRLATEKLQILRRVDEGNRQYQRALASARQELGMMQYQQGKFPAALETLRDAQAQFIALRTEKQNADLEAEIADCLVGIGHCQWDLSRPRDAVASYDAARKIREPLVAGNPLPLDRAELARIYGSLGQAQAAAGDDKAALASYLQGLAVRETLVRNNPYVIDFQFDLALSYKQVADQMEEQTRFTESLPMREKSVALFEQVLQLNPPNVRYASALATARAALSFAMRKGFKRHDEAETQLHLAIGIWQGLVRRNVAAAAERYSLAQGLAQLGLLHLQLDDFETAAIIFESSNATLYELLREQPKHGDYLSQVSINTNNSAYCLQRLGRWEEGLKQAADVLLLREQLAKNFPQVPEHARKLTKSREDLNASATIYIDRKLPIAEDTPPRDQLKLQRDRLEVWQRWRAKFPTVDEFKKRESACEAVIEQLTQQ